MDLVVTLVLLIKMIEKSDELLVTMTTLTNSGHPARQDFERSEQAGGAVALVVVGHSATSSLFQRQTRLRPIVVELSPVAFAMVLVLQ